MTRSGEFFWLAVFVMAWCSGYTLFMESRGGDREVWWSRSLAFVLWPLTFPAVVVEWFLDWARRRS